MNNKYWLFYHLELLIRLDLVEAWSVFYRVID